MKEIKEQNSSYLTHNVKISIQDKDKIIFYTFNPLHYILCFIFKLKFLKYFRFIFPPFQIAQC